MCMIFLSQITVSAILGPLISAFGSHLVIVLFASSMAFLSAIVASVFVIYEVRDDKDEENRTKEVGGSGVGKYSDSDEDERKPLLCSRPVIN